MNSEKSKKIGFKHTPLGWIPDDWSFKKIIEISKKVTDGEHATPQRSDGGYYLLSARNIQDGWISLDDVDFVGSLEYERIKKRCNPEFGDILISCSGTIGRVALVPNNLKAVMVRSAALIKPNHTIVHNIFLQFALQSFYLQKQILNTINKGAQANLFINHIEGLNIILPKLSEQISIAHLLSKWDKGIETTQKLISQKELRKKWLMQQLLTGKKRLKGFYGEWKEYTYDKLLKIVKRSVEWNDEALYNLISVRRRSGGIFLREALYGHQIKVKDLRNTEAGDFLFSKMQILHGASALVTKEFAGAKISGSYIAVVQKDPKILGMDFFNWYSQTPYFYHQTYISSYGVHIEKMTFDFETFLSLEMILPSKEEQTAIAQVLQTADKEIQVLKNKLDKLKEQKKGLMQVLLTGKKRLKV